MPGRAVGKSVGGLGIGDHQYHGLVKVRLAHRENGSLLVPDQVYLESPTVWFQPNTFLPCILGQLDDEIRARLWVNVEGGHTLGVDITDSGMVARLPDGAYLYRATISGPKELTDFASGSWSMLDSRPHLRLYHHTTETAKRSIESMHAFFGSEWNFQGTRKLKNVRYVYFTSLQRDQGVRVLERLGSMLPISRSFEHLENKS